MESVGCVCSVKTCGIVLQFMVLFVCLFVCLFVPQDGKMMFEQELYNNFSLCLSRPYFITFAGDVSFSPYGFSHFSFYFWSFVFKVNIQLYSGQVFFVVVFFFFFFIFICW